MSVNAVYLNEPDVDFVIYTDDALPAGYTVDIELRKPNGTTVVLTATHQASDNAGQGKYMVVGSVSGDPTILDMAGNWTASIRFYDGVNYSYFTPVSFKVVPRYTPVSP